MEGSGVTNYATDKPSYAFSTATTEFDDALVDRGIVTHTQAMVAKGASIPEAQRLTQLQQQQKDVSEQTTTNLAEKTTANSSDDNDDDDDSFLDDDDDEFMNRYRQERLAQLQLQNQQRQQGTRFGQAILIDRTEWTRHVNDASQQAWVVVCLTSSDRERTGCMEDAVQALAVEQPSTKFVLIGAHQAIPDWPHANLPSLFVYRHGTMQKQLVRLPHDISMEELYDLLKPILESETSSAKEQQEEETS